MQIWFKIEWILCCVHIWWIWIQEKLARSSRVACVLAVHSLALIWTHRYLVSYHITYRFIEWNIEYLQKLERRLLRNKPLSWESVILPTGLVIVAWCGHGEHNGNCTVLGVQPSEKIFPLLFNILIINKMPFIFIFTLIINHQIINYIYIDACAILNATNKIGT